MSCCEWQCKQGWTRVGSTRGSGRVEMLWILQFFCDVSDRNVMNKCYISTLAKLRLKKSSDCLPPHWPWARSGRVQKISPRPTLIVKMCRSSTVATLSTNIVIIFIIVVIIIYIIISRTVTSAMSSLVFFQTFKLFWQNKNYITLF